MVDRRPANSQTVTVTIHNISVHIPLCSWECNCRQLLIALRDRHNTDEQVPPPSNDFDVDSASKLDKTMLRDTNFRSKGPAVYTLSFELRNLGLTALVRKMVAIDPLHFAVCNWSHQSPASQAIIQNEGGTNEVPSLKRWWVPRSLL